ncbi:MAG: hypothetical protein RIQ33_2095 [Bacteroidota bacterium]|jgi:hypothetical protein
MKKIFLIWLLLQSIHNISAQSIFFSPKFGKEDFSINHSYSFTASDSIKFETLKFYISSIQLLNNQKVVFAEKNSFHLIDIEDSESMKINLPSATNFEFDEVKFNIGIDSITNVSGAMGGDLDPINGMYWTWQSGYINFKLMGSSSACKTMNHQFEFHLGGYQHPFNLLQTIVLSSNKNSLLKIEFDVQQFLSGIDFTKQNHIMSPCNDAVLLSKKLSQCFKIN